MAYASRSGRAITNPNSPQAFGVCDRCGIWYNLIKLRYQYEWQGMTLVNLNKRVCPTCMDIPQPQLKAKIVPPDPIPVRDPRPENFTGSNFDPNSRAGNAISTQPPPPLSPLTTELPPGYILEIE